MQKNTLRIGIAGLGTVGAGVFKIISGKGKLLSARAGRKIEVVAVSARNKGKKRGINIGKVKWVKDALSLADDKNVDVVVELIGGSEGVAYKLAKKSLSNKKHFVTANKALIAAHGVELANLAEKNAVSLCFEASVAGGIPIIATIKQGLSGNNINKVAGILNGTCNYILTAMEKDKRDFVSALKEAQELGYAEADPTFDVDGLDAAHKISILAALSFGSAVNVRGMHIEGIRNISLADIKYADELGYKIKLLGIAAANKSYIEQRVHPCLVAKESPIAQVDGVINAIMIDSDSLGPLFLEGAGAGEQPTASSVVADIVDVAAGRTSLPFGIPAKDLCEYKIKPMTNHKGEYYIRFAVRDKSGVLAALTSALSKEDIGIEQLLQPHTRRDGTADIVVTTHKVSEKAIKQAMSSIGRMDTVLETPCVIRIEN